MSGVSTKAKNNLQTRNKTNNEKSLAERMQHIYCVGGKESEGIAGRYNTRFINNDYSAVVNVYNSLLLQNFFLVAGD